MSVSICMIVKDEARNIEACVEPMIRLVDEIVIVDTGSTDDTRAIAARLGARVFDFPWRDSFAAARNHALEQATGDWIFVLDADDRVVPPEREKLRKLFEKLGNENIGWLMGCVCLTADGGVGTEVEHVRLFQRRPEHRFKYRAHEQVIPAIEKTGGRFAHAGVRIVHVGYRDTEMVSSKIERNLRLIELDCAEMPTDPFPAFYRGVTLSELGRHAEAIVSLELCRAYVGGDSAMFRTLAYALARARCEEDDIDGALETLRCAARAHPGDAALACAEADVLVAIGDLGAAAARLTALATCERRDLTTQDLRLRALYGELLLVLGHHEAAELAARDLIARRPGFGVSWFVLGDALAVQGKFDELDAVLENLARIRGAETARTVIAAVRTAFLRSTEEALVEISAGNDPLIASLRARLHAMKKAPSMPMGSCLGLPWSTDVHAHARRKEPTNAHVHYARLRHDSRKLEHDDHPERKWVARSHPVSGFGFLDRYT